MELVFDGLDEEQVRHLIVWSHPPSGLRALCVIDDVRRGPAAGGIRTQPYPSVQHALVDAARLARAMTAKCALGGLDAGGGKIVVIEHSGLNRDEAFAELGRRIGDLGGRFVAGSDLGTRAEDLAAAAAQTSHVHADLEAAAAGVARGVRACIEACVRVHGGSSLAGVRVGVQGVGAVGRAVARSLTDAGASLVLADKTAERAQHLADELGATVLPAESILEADVDVISPCAVGGVITEARAQRIRAYAVCGGANNILSSPTVADVLSSRGVLLVPDVISSAGGVIEGVGRSVMGIDPGPRVDALGTLAEAVMREAKERGTSTTLVAAERAAAILDS